MDEQLKTLRKDFENLQEAVNQHAIVAVTDPQGRITRVNDKFCEISQYSREELIGQDHRIINSGYHPREFFQDLWATIKSGHVWQGEIKNKAKNGSYYWVATTITPLKSEQGEILEFIAIRADITLQKVAQEKLASLNADLERRVQDRTRELQQRTVELESLFESWPGLYLVLNNELTIVAASDDYLKATMTTRTGIVGLPLFEVFPDNPGEPGCNAVSRLRASLENVLKNSEAHTMAIQRYDIRDENGVFEERYWSPINSPVLSLDGEVRYIIHRVEDVTTFIRQCQSQDETLVNGSERQMEAEVYISTQKIQDINYQLEAANNELESFSYSISHDLRAPLRAVDGFSQAVLEDYSPILPPEGQRYLQTIRNSAQHMGQLIDDLLVFSRLSKAPLRKQRVNVENLVRGVIAEVSSELGSRKIDWQIGVLPESEGDPALLRQVWINLIANAVKYSRNRERTLVEIGSLAVSDGLAYFVRDNGTGFDMRYADQVFGVFKRLHKVEEFEGTGVGLAIVQRIVHRHGGRVWADAEVGRGATFYFTLERKLIS